MSAQIVKILILKRLNFEFLNSKFSKFNTLKIWNIKYFSRSNFEIFRIRDAQTVNFLNLKCSIYKNFKGSNAQNLRFKF